MREKRMKEWLKKEHQGRANKFYSERETGKISADPQIKELTQNPTKKQRRAYKEKREGPKKKRPTEEKSREEDLRQKLRDQEDVISQLQEALNTCLEEKEKLGGGTYTDRAEVSLPRGIKNFGGSCYFNSTIQVFAAIPGVRAALDRIRKQKYTPDCDRYIKAFADLIAAAHRSSEEKTELAEGWEERNKNGRIFYYNTMTKEKTFSRSVATAIRVEAATCIDIVAELSRPSGHEFNRSTQNDPSELFIYMINQLQACTNPGTTILNTGGLYDSKKEIETLSKSKQTFMQKFHNGANDFTRLFLGATVTTTYEPPGQSEGNPIPISEDDPPSNVRMEPTLELSLGYDKTKPLVRLTAMLDSFFEHDFPPDGRTSRRPQMLNLPKVLVFRIDREDTDRPIRSYDRKGKQQIRYPVNQSAIDFPESGLDMAPYVHEKAKDVYFGEQLYNLYAVVLRPSGDKKGGTADSGHYVAVTRTSRAAGWYRYNDTTVEAVDFFNKENEEMLQTNATMLIYVKESTEFA